jgi:glutamate N-acetyltransferase / amino-acid N-acetyltransferase
VTVSRRHLAATGGRAAAVVLSSGNANAATGERGELDAERMCALTADGLGCPPESVLVCATGLVGLPLPTGLIATGVPRLVPGAAVIRSTASPPPRRS